MRSVLILAHSWPPDANVGAVRPVYLSRQLALQGWKPIVITVRESYYDHQNSAGVAGSDVALVIRTHSLPNPRIGYLWLKTLFAWRRRPTTAASTPAQNVSIPNGNTSAPAAQPGLIKRTLLSMLYTPDEFLGWFPFSLIGSIRMIRRHRPECIISTGPPFTSHLVAMVLKWLFGIRWIADFRDPWSWREGIPSEIRSPLSDRINRFLENKVMQYTDCIVCVTPRTTEHYRTLYPNLPGEKWYTINNGFYLDEFTRLGSVEKNNRFTISYVGTFGFSRTPLLFLQAVGEMISEGTLDKSAICIRFIGPCDTAEGRSVAAMISENGLNGIAEIVGFLPRTEAMKEILRANALLLLGGTQRFSIAAKVYEYIASGNPILAMCEEGDTADLIRRIDGGQVVLPNDVNAAKQAISFLYEDYLHAHETYTEKRAQSAGVRDEYNWTYLGERYASLLTTK